MIKDIYIDDIGFLQDLGVRVREMSEYMSIPGINRFFINIPGMHGAHYMHDDLEPRPFVLDCRYLDKSHENMQKTIRTLTTLFFDEYGRTKEVKLAFGHEPEKWYKVRYLGHVPIQKLAIQADFILPLIAYDPYAYAPSTYFDPNFIPRYDTDAYYDTNLEYKNQTGIEFNNPRTYAGVFNYSHYATPFSFVIEGYVHRPKITNLTSGQSTRINVTVKENEKLYFDSRLKTTWKIRAEEDAHFWLTPVKFMKDYDKWDKVNRYNEMTGSFIDLVSGGNHLLFEGGNPDASVTFNWEHRFL